MYSFVSKGDIAQAVLLKFGQYIDDEEYDTDSLKADIEVVCNVDKIFGSKTLSENIKQFIEATTGNAIFYIVKSRII